MHAVFQFRITGLTETDLKRCAITVEVRPTLALDGGPARRFVRGLSGVPRLSYTRCSCWQRVRRAMGLYLNDPVGEVIRNGLQRKERCSTNRQQRIDDR